MAVGGAVIAAIGLGYSIYSGETARAQQAKERKKAERQQRAANESLDIADRQSRSDRASAALIARQRAIKGQQNLFSPQNTGYNAPAILGATQAAGKVRLGAQ